MLYVFSPVKSPRLSYICHWIFSRFPGLDYTLTYDPDILLKDVPVLAYTKEAPAGGQKNFFIPAMGLLADRGVLSDAPNVEWRERPEALLGNDFEFPGQTGLFPFIYAAPDFHSNAGPTSLDFDPFSACFYLVSRMEEYRDEALRDEHGRYKPENSLLFELGCLGFPLADAYVHILGTKLRTGLGLEIAPSEMEWIPSYDIDRPFSSKGLSWGRMIRRTGYCLKHREYNYLWKDLLAWLGLAEDRLWIWPKLRNTMKLAGKKPLIFFLMRGQAPMDINFQWQTLAFEDLVRETDTWARVGIHPSYECMESPRRAGREIHRLQRILKRPVEQSRQHFLRFDLPGTYADLWSHGIKEEYSMGYAGMPGFRAGTAHPFYWYDLGLEQLTSLKVYPLLAMDITFREYLEITPQEVPNRVLALVRQVKFFGGKAVTLWHNESLAAYTGWEAWAHVHDQLTKSILGLENS